MEAILKQDEGSVDLTAAVALSAGQIIQTGDGSPGRVTRDIAAAALGTIDVEVGTLVKITKTTGIKFLDGGRVYWDHSANAADYKKVNDRDFYLGRAYGDAESAADTMLIRWGVDPAYDIELARDPYLTVPVGTQALGGFLPPQRLGGALAFNLTATNEAQKVDALSVDRFAVSANAIAEFIFRLPNGGSSNAVDYSIGLANGTHATDADSITDSIFVHIDGGATDLLLESDDGTTEVAATDSNVDFTAGSAVANRVEVWIDMRNPADVQIYVNGVNVLPDSVFNVSASTASWGLLVHVEKTSGTATADLVVDAARVRFSEQ